MDFINVTTSHRTAARLSRATPECAAVPGGRAKHASNHLNDLHPIVRVVGCPFIAPYEASINKTSQATKDKETLDLDRAIKTRLDFIATKGFGGRLSIDVPCVMNGQDKTLFYQLVNGTVEVSVKEDGGQPDTVKDHTGKAIKNFDELHKTFLLKQSAKAQEPEPESDSAWGLSPRSDGYAKDYLVQFVDRQDVTFFV